MKKLFALLCFVALSAGVFAQPASIDLGSRGHLTLYFAEGWKVAMTNMGGQATVNVTPTGDANATCTLMISMPEQDRLDTKSRLKLRLEADARNVAEGSVEGKAIGREFTLATGFGFYCNFTDAAMKGKPPEKGNYKVMSMGKIRLAPDVIIDVQIMADDFRGRPYQELLGAIEGMEYKR
ncbi:MAG: hypothetical protein RIQ93_716 [Verrucomicrobiota bacterium]|jgi:hypothetical protein